MKLEWSTEFPETDGPYVADVNGGLELVHVKRARKYMHRWWPEPDGIGGHFGKLLTDEFSGEYDGTLWLGPLPDAPEGK